MRPPREDTQPWYKQFWPWFLISLPASVVVAAIYTINLAIETNDGLVSGDYYKEGLAIHKNADSTANAKALGVAAQVEYDSDTGSVSVRLDKALPERVPVLSMKAVHPTMPNQDQEIQLTGIDDTAYVGRLEPVNVANWKLSIYPADKAWRIEGRLSLPDTPQTRLD